jgi:hypothetical protein
MADQSRSSKKDAATSTAASTTATAAAAGDKVKSILKTGEKQASQFPAFRVDLKYRNTLPSIPFDPHFLDIPFPPDFLWGFRQSTLEKNYKYRIHMNPPQLTDDMIDPLGAEEWAKAMEFDERDKALQRKEGVEAKASKHSGVNRDAKTWMLKTIYTRENVHRQQQFEMSQDSAENNYLVGEEEDEDLRKRNIEEQFALANSGVNPTPAPGKQIKRVLPLLPSRTLREINLHLIRYKVGEKIMKDSYEQEKDDEWTVNRGILVRRSVVEDDSTAKQPNKYTPLSLFLPRTIIKSSGGSNDDDEEDLFAEDEEAPPEVNTTAAGAMYDTKHVEYIREYQVQTIGAKQKNPRLAMVFEEDAVRYVELEDDSLRLFRIKRPGERERLEMESNVELTVSMSTSPAERRERTKRRKTIEGGDLRLELDA